MPMALVGCQSSPPKTSQKPPEPENSPPTAVQTGALDISWINEDKKDPADRTKATFWNIHGASAVTSFSPGEKGVGPTKLKGVTGDISDNKGVITRFSADTADADQATHALSLQGNVRVVSVGKSTPSPDETHISGAGPGDVILSCDHLHWMEDKGLIAAEGNVVYKLGVLTMGPAEVQWASKDLVTIGSPDQFP